MSPPIVRMVNRFTDDLDLRDDLIQEALIWLWEMDPTRYDLNDPGDVGYIRKALANRVYTMWRADPWRRSSDAFALPANHSLRRRRQLGVYRAIP
jgi:hypothetical protein